MSRFTEKMFRNARTATTGMVTGEPHEPVRHTWGEVHERARRIAGGLAAAGIGHGDAVGVLAGCPVEIAPTAQGLWMRGASLTMLHQPTPRTDLAVWAEDTMTVIGMIEAKAVIVSEPFLVAVPVLEEKGIKVLTVERPAGVGPDRPRRGRRGRSGADAADVRFDRLAEGRPDHPPQHLLQRRGDVHRRPVRRRQGRHGQLAALLPRHGHGRLPDHPDVLRRRAGQGHADGLPARHAAVGQADRQVQGHDDRGAQLRLRAARQAAAPQAKPGEFDLSTLRFALSGAEPVEPADVEDLLDAGKPFGLQPSAILPAYGMAETTLAVSFSECNAGLVVDEVDADLLAALRRAVPATKGNTRRLATLGPLLKDLEARIIDENGNVMPARGVGVIELRGESLTPGYLTMGGFIPAQDEHGWYDTGDLGYLTENGHVVVCGRVKDVIIMAGRNIYPTDIERAAGRVEGVRPGCAVAVRLDAGHSRETFAVAVESNAFQDPAEVRRIEHQVAHEVVAEVDVRPRNVVVLGSRAPSRRRRRASCAATRHPRHLILLARRERARRRSPATPDARGLALTRRGRGFAPAPAPVR